MTDPEKSLPVSAPVPAESDPAEGAEPQPEEPRPEPLTPERVNEWNRYYDRYVSLSVLVLVFIVSANKITHSSIWEQLQTGRAILSRGMPVTTDLFSYTEAGKPWVNAHWLFDLGQALVFKAGSEVSPSDPADPISTSAKAEQFGAGTMVALSALARMLTALLLLKVRRPGPGTWWAAVCVAAAMGAVVSPAALLNPRSSGGLPGMILLGGLASPGMVTPGTWGLLLFVLELLLIHHAVNLGHKKAAFALPFLFALWANVDDSFLVGLMVLAAAAVGRVWDARRDGRESLTGPTAFGVLVASVAACLLNPSHVGVFTAAFEPFLGLIRTTGDRPTLDQLSFFSEELRKNGGEWRVQLSYYFVLVSFGLASFFLNRRRFSVGRFLVFLLVSVLWATLIRFGSEFAVVLAATAALNGQEWYETSFGTEGKLGRGWTFWSVGGRCVTLLVVSLCVMKALTGVGGFYNDTEFGFGFDPDDFAFEAAAFLRSAPIEGNVLNTTAAQGDALIWRAYPDRKTFYDSRRNLFSRKLLRTLRDTRVALSTDEIESWKSVLDEYKVSVVMLHMSSSLGGPPARVTYRALMQSLNWLPIYDDGQVVMFGRVDTGTPAADVAFFQSKALNAGALAFRQTRPTPPPDRLPSAVSWYDTVFQTRAMAKPQPHTDASRRWLAGPSYDPSSAVSLPDPANCLLAIREARTALASKPDDSQAFRLLANAYRSLMLQESALLNGIALTPENAKKVMQVTPRPEVLMSRFRQRATALNYAIQTTPPPQSQAARRELMTLNLELFQLWITVNYLDLARDRLETVVKSSRPGDFTPEDLVVFSQDLARLNEAVKQEEGKMEEMRIEQSAGPLNLASYAISRGVPGLAIHELEEAERTGTNPAQVKPLLLDLYCDTGQPDKAVEILSAGQVGDPTFGTEPGISEMRHGRTYFLWGNYEYASTLWEKNAIFKLRAERTMRTLDALPAFLKGDIMLPTSKLLEIPEKLANQAAWEFDNALCRLEGGMPTLAGEHFTKALTLVPNLSVRPVIAYYLEQLGLPVPPESSRSADAKPKTPSGSVPAVENAREKGASEPATKPK